MDLSNLINLLPSYFKEKDTYKDSDNRGILERFLSIMGNYFKDNISPDIDNILDIIDLDFDTSSLLEDDSRKKYEHLFLNQIWEFLGEIPFGYSALYRDDVQSNPWLENMDSIPRAKCRRILKYAISLYKIRGTLDFYNILLSFYDLSCTLLDPSGTPNNPNGMYGRVLKDNVSVKYNGNSDEYLGIKEVGDITQIYSTIYDSDTRYDMEDTHYDSSNDCLSCTDIYITISTKKVGELDDSQKSRVLNLLNKFRPVNVVPFSLENTNFINY